MQNTSTYEAQIKRLLPFARSEDSASFFRPTQNIAGLLDAALDTGAPYAGVARAEAAEATEAAGRLAHEIRSMAYFSQPATSTADQLERLEIREHLRALPATERLSAIRAGGERWLHATLSQPQLAGVDSESVKHVRRWAAELVQPNLLAEIIAGLAALDILRSAASQAGSQWASALPASIDADLRAALAELAIDEPSQLSAAA